jgi:hypothetical protein
MKNEYHNFEEGQEVICISGNFPFVPEYSKNKIDTLETKPVIGQRLIIDEILGEFLNFDCFNKKDQNGNVLIYNWFKHDRFSSITNSEAIEGTEYASVAILLTCI